MTAGYDAANRALRDWMEEGKLARPSVDSMPAPGAGAKRGNRIRRASI